MKFLVTAGGTSESIDRVRCITNFATGRLGSLVADCLAQNPEAERIFYICGETAARPESPKAEILPVTGAADAEAAVRRVLAENSVAAIAHSMAVSDYTVESVTTPRLYAASPLDAGLDRTGKLPSGEDRLILVLRPTVKIISLFHQLAPEALLVGFKLLDGASFDTLIDAAYELLQKNHCAYVLANEVKDMRADTHTGYLVDRGRNVEKYMGKLSIARAIAASIWRGCKAGAGN
jgi:phosphopantothenate-cysteine ligase